MLRRNRNSLDHKVCGDVTKLSKRLPTDCAAFLAEVKDRIHSTQYEALKSANKKMVVLYWDISNLVVERQTNAEQLAADTRQEFSGVSGYSRRNVFYMREFYLAYCDLPKVQPLVAQIG